MNTERMVEVPQDKLIALIKGAYERSHAIGLGYLQPHEKSLSDEDAEALIEKTGRVAVSLDYVNGRQCKFNVWRDEDGKLWTNKDAWYDHSSSQLADLLSSVGIAP